MPLKHSVAQSKGFNAFKFRKFKLKHILVLSLLLLIPVNYAQLNSQTEVKIINTSDIQKILVNEKGSAVLINVWATWCEPCREEFPDLVKLANAYENRIHFIGISVDDASDISNKVIPFLESQNARFTNYLLKIREPEDFINLLDKNWSGAVPATFIYNKTGKQREVLIGKQNYSAFETAIKKVID